MEDSFRHSEPLYVRFDVVDAQNLCPTLPEKAGERYSRPRSILYALTARHFAEERFARHAHDEWPFAHPYRIEITEKRKIVSDRFAKANTRIAGEAHRIDAGG